MPWKLLLVQLLATALGILLGRRITSRIPDIQLETLLQRVPVLRVMTVFGALVLVAVMALEASDSLCQRLPLLWQRHRAATNWMAASGLFGLASGFCRPSPCRPVTISAGWSSRRRWPARPCSSSRNWR